MRGLKVKPIPLILLMMGSGFCLANGLLIGRQTTLNLSGLSSEHHKSWEFIVGMTIWAAGFLGNKWHDRRLIQLKRESGGQYVVPTGGLFKYVSGANFLCEILEWCGFALATNLCLPALTFVWVTVSTIGPRAFHHHIWYLEKFGDKYPRKRKALIPFLF